MDRSIELRENKISTLLLQFSLPAIVGMLVNALYNVAGRIFVGVGVGSLAIAGLTICFPIMTISMAFAMLIGLGATALVSIRLGQEKKDEAELVVGNAFVLLLIASVTVAILGLLFVEPLLRAFGASESILPYAVDYLRIILMGTPLMAVGYGLNNIIRAEGNPRIAMYTMLIGAGVSIVLYYLAIFILGWGVTGVALATIIAQGVTAVWVLNYFLSGDSLLKLRLKNLKLRSFILTSILAIGFPPFGMQLASSLQQVILNRSLGEYGGDLAISVLGVVFSVFTIFFMPIIGISQGAQPIIGFNYGARRYDRVKETLKLANIVATIVVCVGFLIIQIWPAQLIGLFTTDDQALIKMGTHAMRVCFAMMPIIGFQVVSSNYFQAVGKPKQAAILSLSRQLLIFIPLLLILPPLWGLEGVWRSLPCADGLSVMMTSTFLFYELKNLGHDKKGVLPQEAGL